MMSIVRMSNKNACLCCHCLCDVPFRHSVLCASQFVCFCWCACASRRDGELMERAARTVFAYVRGGACV